MTCFNFRFVPAFYRMKELMQEGYVGSRVLHVEASWFSERRADPNLPFGWRDEKEAVGFGAMGDVGVHLVDLVRWLAGDFKRVCGQQAIFTKERPLADGSGKRDVTVEDCALFIRGTDRRRIGFLYGPRSRAWQRSPGDSNLGQ